ncbi:hypothetical protein LOK49_LG08G00119 [Camellia lanceoleosa]|uniref:Uncharacterized protein n=1 Tax=Camellia lanceoleosa TaxID=1840588 RepID=A0ACC0GSZ9_9ERIC|nr:hypothetical protein LOK49_LG08G00119 [Camellia lanceoleosa]
MSVKSNNRQYEIHFFLVVFFLQSQHIANLEDFFLCLPVGFLQVTLLMEQIKALVYRHPDKLYFLNNTLERLVIKVAFNLYVRMLKFCSMAGRGVDLNLNWSVDWGKKKKKREGLFALFMLYDHKNTTPDGLHSHRIRLMLEKLNHLHCEDRCIVGSGYGSVTTHYMYDIARVPMAFTFEIYGDRTASSKDCFKMFNPADLTYLQCVRKLSMIGRLHSFAMFNMSTHQLDELGSKALEFQQGQVISIDDYLDGYLMERSSRYGKKMEVLDLGMQEIRTYFRLFLLSSVLLLFMFCSRISKSNRPLVSWYPT